MSHGYGLNVIVPESCESVLVSDVHAIDLILENKIKEFYELIPMIIKAGSDLFEY